MKNRKCSVGGCDREYYSKGLCANHYSIWRRNGDPLKRRNKKFEGFCIKCGSTGPFHVYVNKSGSTVQETKCKKCRLEDGYNNKKNNINKYRKYNREWKKKKYIELREAILLAYGKKCVCCGEEHPAFLVIDHKNGGGRKHRKELNKSTMNFYLWIVKNEFPEDFQILCHNCNFAKSNNGGLGCPHKFNRTE